MNSITDLLDLEDANISISSIDIEGQTKTIYLETAPEAHFCPCCGFRMHSRGTKNRKINHPILQDNYKLVLILKQRRWRCTNPDCLYDISDSFKFVSKNRRTTNATDMLIVDAYRNLAESSASISKRFHVSDTYAHDVFDRYVKLDRLPLTDAISVDEVFLDMDDNCKYALVIQDFHTGEPIDLLRSRRMNVTEPYFTSLPPEECIFRKNCASVPEERSAIPLQTEQSSAGLLVAIIYSTIPARKFKTICLGCHSA